MNTETSPPWSLRRLLLLLMLIGMGLLGNVLAPSLFTGFNYLFGSVAVLVVLRLYGVGWAIVTALIAASWCQVLFGHPTAMVWLTLEPVFVWGWLKRRPQGSMIIADMAFWLLIGLPLLFVLFLFALKVSLLGTTAAALMYGMIGITNALLASIVLTLLPLERLAGSRSLRSPVQLGPLLFQLLMAVILVPAIFVLATNGRERESFYSEMLLDSLERGSGRIAFGLRDSVFPQGFPQPIIRRVLSDEQRSRLQALLVNVKGAQSLDLSLLDQENGLLATTSTALSGRTVYDPLGSEFQKFPTSRPASWRRLPPNKPPIPLWQRAARSSFVHIQPIPGADLRLVSESSFAPYQTKIVTGHRNALAILLAYVLVVLSLAMLVARSIVSPLLQLSRVTTDLPEKLISEQDIVWPGAFVEEIGQLSGNIRTMAAQLSKQFREIADANATLEHRVADRTRELSATNQSLHQEIDDRIKAERQRDHLMQELATQLKLLQTLLDALPNPVYYKDRAGRYLGCNHAFELTVGLTRDKLMGKTVEEIYPADIASIYRASDEKLLRTGGVQLYEAGLVYPDGKARSIIVNKAAFGVSDQEPGGIIGTFIDISDLKQAEQERDRLMTELQVKNKELEGIIYVASHDLRSPLVNIQGFSRKLGKHCNELLRLLQECDHLDQLREAAQPVLTEAVPRSVNFITGSVEKMDALLNGLLRLSRLGREAVTIEELDMNAMMGKIVDSLTFQLDAVGAVIETGRLLPCRGDAVQVNQIFTNLLDNAIKYRSLDRPLVIRISCEAYPDAVHYCVEDNGIGIPQAHQAHIWEIFHRLNPRDIPGEGLGLTMARRIVDRLGGAIWVESEEGIGSRLYVKLPAVST